MGFLDRTIEWVEESSRRYALFLLSFYIISFAGSWVLSAYVTADTQARISFSGLLVNSLLTIILIAVYLQMAESQSRQTKETKRQANLQKKVIDIQANQKEIQERQERWMEANHKPVVQVRNIGFSDEGLLQLICSNKGNGVAANLSIQCIISIPRESAENYIPQYVALGETDDVPEAVSDIQSKESPLQVKGNNIRTRKGISLSPEESQHLEAKVDFVRKDSFAVQNDEDSRGYVGVEISFEEVINELYSEGIQRFKFSTFLLYEGVLETEYQIPLFEGYADSQSGLSFKEAVEEWIEDHELTYGK